MHGLTSEEASCMYSYIVHFLKGNELGIVSENVNSGFGFEAASCKGLKISNQQM